MTIRFEGSELMTIICDSREQKWDHVREYFDRSGVLWLRSKLPVGDYGRMDNLTCVIDRKQNLNEVESNVIHQHDRFRRECQLAQSHGIRLIILVEEPWCRGLDDVMEWANPRRQRWMRLDRQHAEGKMLDRKISGRPPVNGRQLHAIMETMRDKYGIEWRFCSPGETGAEICQILGTLPTASNGG